MILQKKFGVIFQTIMSMDKHISSVVKSCFYQLQVFRRRCPFMSTTAFITHVNAFVHSRLEFSDSLFYGFSKCAIHRLNKVKSLVVCIVTNAYLFSHVTPTLKYLH